MNAPADQHSSYRRNLFAITAACFIGFAGFTLVMPFLPLYLQELGVTSVADVASWSGISLGVTPGITALLPHATAESVNRFLPLNAGSAVLTSTVESLHRHLSPWAGFGVFCLYAAVTIAVAAVALVRRDA